MRLIVYAEKSKEKESCEQQRYNGIQSRDWFYS
jgi:hypothetical protein